MTVPTYRRTFFIGLVLIAMGVAFMNSIPLGALGTIFIALGGYFFIVSMARKRQEEQTHHT